MKFLQLLSLDLEDFSLVTTQAVTRRCWRHLEPSKIGRSFLLIDCLIPKVVIRVLVFGIFGLFIYWSSSTIFI
ncbi:hypothetical protein BsWGS_22589 [Bradybaena similaris]